MVNSTHAATVTERGLLVNPLWALGAVGGGIALGTGAVFAPELTVVALIGLALVPVVFVSPILGLCALTFASFLEEYVGISGGFTVTKVLDRRCGDTRARQRREWLPERPARALGASRRARRMGEHEHRLG
jgi:hypothetical protein